MPNHSSLTIIGHLGRDAEAKTVGDNQQVKVSFSVATTRKRKDEEITTWWRCSFWGERAAKVSQFLNKGKAVMVQGEAYVREYEKDGALRFSLEVDVRELVLLGDGKRDEPAAPAPARAHAPQRPAPATTADDAGDPPF